MVSIRAEEWRFENDEIYGTACKVAQSYEAISVRFRSLAPVPASYSSIASIRSLTANVVFY